MVELRLSGQGQGNVYTAIQAGTIINTLYQPLGSWRLKNTLICLVMFEE